MTKATLTGIYILSFLGLAFAGLFANATAELADDVRFSVAVSQTAGLAVVAVVCWVGAIVVTNMKRHA